MDLDKILDALRKDRDNLDEAILALERLLPGSQKQSSNQSAEPAERTRNAKD